MSEYKEEKETRYKIRANDIIYNQLPEFSHLYFKERRDLAGSTKLSYAYSLLEFFNFLHDNNYFDNKEIIDYEASDINTITRSDFEDYFTLKEITNKNISKKDAGTVPNTLKRAKACLSSFWAFYIDAGILNVQNPLKPILMPKTTIKDPTVLTKEECKLLLRTIEYGTGLSNKKLENHDRCKNRDYAIVYLFLHTGIRVSELVGIDLTDIHWDTHSLIVKRKGHKEQEIFFSDDVERVLDDYIKIRKDNYWIPSSPPALFLNRFGERITERSIERMIDKYVSVALPNRKNISCHKLRSTYAMQLLRYSGNLDLVSQSLGHSSITTTQIYARTDKDTRSLYRNFDFQI